MTKRKTENENKQQQIKNKKYTFDITDKTRIQSRAERERKKPGQINFQ